MSFKTIMAHVGDDDGPARPVESAIRVAKAFGSQLTGVYLTPGLEMSPSVAVLVPAEAVERRMRESGEAQHRAERAFRSAAQAAGVGQVDWRAPAGSAIEAATAHGRCTDLVVIGQGEPGATRYGFAEELLTTTILTTGRPSLVIPYIGARNTLGENVLIAWDGSRESSRAIADAMPFLETARQVSVVAVNRNRNGDSAEDAVGAPARLAAWLSAHGIAVEVARDDVDDVGIADWLLSRAADADCDLIVMGGYGHARVREVVLGGVTRSMLRSMTVPLLMSH